MPNWSDDEGRCHYMVGRVPCWQSSIGCPMHAVEKEKPKRQRQPRKTRLTKKQYAEEMKMREQVAYSCSREVAAAMYAKAEMELRESLYQNALLRQRIEELEHVQEAACENTPTKGCECPGCETARERAEKGEA